MSPSYFKGRSWHQITREERVFCAELENCIRKDKEKFIEILKDESGLPDHLEGPWEVAYEACFYRDFLHCFNKAAKNKYSTKRTKMRLACPDERHPKQLEHPQSEWDLLHGMLMSHQEGDVPVARAYLHRNAEGNEDFSKDLLQVWAAENTDEDLRKETQSLLFGLNL